MNTIVRLKRGKKESNYIPLEGEPVYVMDTKELLIGDGIHKVSELKPTSILNNIVHNDYGQLYKVNIVKDEKEETEKAILTPLNTNNYNFYI